MKERLEINGDEQMSYYELAAKRIRNIDPNLYRGISQKSYKEVRSRGEYEADTILIAEYYRRVGVFCSIFLKEEQAFMWEWTC